MNMVSSGLAARLEQSLTHLLIDTLITDMDLE